MRHIGVLIPVVFDDFFSGILGGISDAVYEHGMWLVLRPTRHDHAREVALLNQLKQNTHGAVLVLPEESSEELVPALSDCYPFVVCDPLEPLDPQIPSVTAANASGAEQAIEHLVALGHRRIAAITGPPGWAATEERRRGYRAAHAAAGIPFEPELEVAADFDFEPGAHAAAALLALAEPPTAIFAFNDLIAIGAMRAARASGVAVPADLSMVGFDDSSFATVVEPQLTTVRQPLADLGRRSVDLLVRLIRGEDVETLRLESATRLVVRETTAPPRPET